MLYFNAVGKILKTFYMLQLCTPQIGEVFNSCEDLHFTKLLSGFQTF